MSLKKRTFFKSSDARGFLFFLLLTSVVAILIKLSKDYTQACSIPISIAGVPLDKTIKTISPQELAFNAKISGFSMLRNSLKTPELEINFSSLDSITSSRLSYDTSRLNSILKEVMPGGKEFSNYNSSSIAVGVDVLSTKKVPVLVDVQLDFNNGYNTYDSAIVTPDSVTVVGPLGELEKVKGIQTHSQKVDNVTNEVSLTLELDTLAVYENLKFSASKFRYTQKVAKYTEGSFSIPVTVNGINREKVKIFPREVELFFVASLDEYDSVLPTDFEIVADFSQRRGAEEHIVLSISREPSNVRNVRLGTKHIKFIVVN